MYGKISKKYMAVFNMVAQGLTFRKFLEIGQTFDWAIWYKISIISA